MHDWLIVPWMVVALDLAATVVVVRSALYTRRQKSLQVLLAWLVPVVGAIACLVAARNDARPYRPATGEFVDNAGA